MADTPEPGLAPSPAAKAPTALRTISEVSAEVGVPQHILRFWETRFPELKPMKRGGNRRYYRPQDVALCKALKRLLHEEGYTVRGVRKLIAEGGEKSLSGRSPQSLNLALAPLGAEEAPMTQGGATASARPSLPAAAGSLPPVGAARLATIRDRLALAVRSAGSPGGPVAAP